jgi:hypothetical protein
MKVLRLSMETEHLGAVFLLLKFISYCPGAGTLESSTLARLVTLLLQENPFFFDRFWSMKLAIVYMLGLGVF